MRKIAYFLLLASIFTFVGCAGQTVLVVNKDGKVVQRYRGRLGEKVSIVFVRKDGTFETYSPDRGSVTFSRDGKKVFYHGTWYEYRGGRYWGGYSPYWGDGLRAGDNPDAPRMYWR